MYKGKWDVEFTLNDYELLYLARLHDEEAINLIIKKYEKLIYKFNQKFDVSVSNYEDYLQEGRIIINKAIKSFDANSNKSFTRYVELLLYHRYIDLTRKNNVHKYEIISDDTIDYLTFETSDIPKVNEEIIINYEDLSKLEQKIYSFRYDKNMKPRDISNELNIPITRVYSALERIKRKIRK